MILLPTLKNYPVLRFMVQLLALTAVILSALWVLWLFGVDANTAGEGLATVASQVKPYRWVIAFVRWCVWLVVWWQWTHIGHCLIWGDHPGTNKTRLRHWNTQRGTVMGLIAVVEVAIVISFVRF